MGTASRHTTAFRHDGRSLEDWCIAKAEDGTWYHRRPTWPGYVHGEASAKGDVLLEDVFATMRETLRGAQESLYLQTDWSMRMTSSQVACGQGPRARRCVPTLVRLEEWFDQLDPLHRLRKPRGMLASHPCWKVTCVCWSWQAERRNKGAQVVLLCSRSRYKQRAGTRDTSLERALHPRAFTSVRFKMLRHPQRARQRKCVVCEP